jgi:hypothetical protein
LCLTRQSLGWREREGISRYYGRTDIQERKRQTYPASLCVKSCTARRLRRLRAICSQKRVLLIDCESVFFDTIYYVSKIKSNVLISSMIPTDSKRDAISHIEKSTDGSHLEARKCSRPSLVLYSTDSVNIVQRLGYKSSHAGQHSLHHLHLTALVGVEAMLHPSLLF